MWIDKFFLIYRTIRDAGTDKPPRAAINFVGATIEDDPDNDQTNIFLPITSHEIELTGTSINHSTVNMTDGNGDEFVPEDGSYIGIFNFVARGADGASRAIFQKGMLFDSAAGVVTLDNQTTLFHKDNGATASAFDVTASASSNKLRFAFVGALGITANARGILNWTRVT